MFKTEIEFGLGSDNSGKDPVFPLPFRKTKKIWVDNRQTKLMRQTPNNSSSTEESSKDCTNSASTSPDAFVMQGANCLLFENFFSIVEKRDSTDNLKKMGGLTAQCKICSAQIKGTLAVSSNFIAHLRKKHTEKYEEYCHEKNEKAVQLKTAEDFNTRVLEYIASAGVSLCTVDNPKFRKMFKGFPCKVQSRRTITRLLEDLSRNSTKDVRQALSKVEFLCTTADIWSEGKKSFLGYTCHWIDANLQRKSVALACKQIYGIHNYTKIASVINVIHRKYSIDCSKILLTITDNGSNFVKAFKEYGLTVIPEVKVEFEQESEDEVDEEEHHSENDQVEDINDESVRFITIDRLPKHFRCASHTLNLVSTTDFSNILKKNDSVCKRHKQCFQRCSNLWNKCNRPKSAEIITNILSRSPKTPTVTRWNSLYDSVMDLLKYKSKLVSVCTDLNIPHFIAADIEYMEEYVTLMRPIAETLDFMQAEKRMYFGFYVAAITSLKYKFEILKTSHTLKSLDFAIDDLIQCLIKRFQSVFTVDKEAEGAFVAAITCPSVKLKFVAVLKATAPNIRLEIFKEMCIRNAGSASSTNSKELVVDQSDDDFLVFGDEGTNQAHFQHDLRRELELYLLDSDTTFNCFSRYPLIKQLFIKYNTPLPSSAPVERLFSFAGMINSPRRRNLTGSNFERLTLMKANDHASYLLSKPHL